MLNKYLSANTAPNFIQKCDTVIGASNDGISSKMYFKTSHYSLLTVSAKPLSEMSDFRLRKF